jgi:hypothetical protein
LPNSSNAEKQNANQFAGLIADVIEWKEMARQREEFIKSISKGINNGVFVDKLKLLKNDLGAETQCLDEVFNLLPDYYRTPEFISALSRYSTQTISNYLKEIPSIEIAEYFQMIFNQLVNAKD